MHTILLIDDTPAHVRFVEDFLRFKGYNVVSADNALDGLLLAHSLRPHLILMDIRMPEMDGISATTIIRANPDLAHTRIVALTASAMVGDREKMLASGFDGYCAKPVRLEEFFDYIKQFLP